MKNLLYIALAFVFFAVDQLSKWAVTQYMIKPKLGEAYGAPMDFISWISTVTGRLPFASIEITPFFNIVMAWNTGVSFSLFNDGGEMGAYILIALSLIISLFFLIWMLRTDSHLVLLANALVIGGAIGNVIDRARFGAVVDFLDVHAFGYHWPAFNVADSCIVVGVALLIIQSLFFETDNKNAK